MDKFDLLIFDCDGVLVDSERITNSVFAGMLNEMGLPVTLEDMFDTFVGKSMATCLEIIQHKLGKPVPDNFVIEYRQRTKKAIQTNLIPDDSRYLWRSPWNISHSECHHSTFCSDSTIFTNISSLKR